LAQMPVTETVPLHVAPQRRNSYRVLAVGKRRACPV
jgi:hypothetical protein